MVANPDSVFQSLDNEHSPLELLMVGSSVEDATRCANALRDSGQPVRMESAETRDGLIRLLETEPADLVTVNADSKQLPPDIAIEMIREENPAAAIILLSEDPPAWAAFASEQGVRDLLHPVSVGRLVFAIQREFRTLLLRQELARTRRELESTEYRFRKLLENARDGIAYIHEGLHIQSNVVYRDLFGLDDEEVSTLTMMDLVAADARDRFKRMLRDAQAQETRQRIRFRHRDGSEFEAEVQLTPMEMHGEACLQVLIRHDATDDALEARIRELTDRDPHTQLLNRHAFMRGLERLRAQEGFSEDSLLLKVGIDNFSELCDRDGIDLGDRLLARTAECLREHFADDPLLSRFGDHEFMVVTRSGESPEAVAEHCLEHLRHAGLERECGLSDTPSFSITVVPVGAGAGSDVTVHELIRRCRRAVRHTGADGEHESEPISVFNDSTGTEDAFEEADAQIVGLIDGALENDRFRLLYQPIVSLEGDTRENYSVFVRLLDDKGVEREPAWFYRHADRSERLGEIDRWVIRRAIGELARHRAQGRKINFHITLSREGALDDSMLLWVCDCLREFKAKGGWLFFQFELELLRESPPELARLVEGLRKINCRISCNGVPADFDDRELLERFQVDLVRLAPSLVQNLHMDAEVQDRLAQVNGRLQEWGVRTVATGIEQADTLAILWNLGVNYIQGYFLQPPAPTIDAADSEQESREL